MKLLTRICIDRPLLGWIVVTLLWIPPLLGFCGFRIAETMSAGWVSADVLEELQEQQRQFQSNSSLALVLTCDDFFERQRVAALHDVVGELRTSDHVRSLTWAGDIPEVTLLGRERHLLPNREDLSVEELQDAKKELLKHPLTAGHLISEDGRTLLLLVDTHESIIESQAGVSGIERIRRDVADRLEPLSISTGVTGILALYEVQQRALTQDNRRIQLLSYCVVAVLLLVIFRRPIAIVLAGSGPVVGVIWTMGWLRLTGQANNELAKIILPVMVMMIGFTDGVHLIMRFRQLRSAGKAVDESSANEHAADRSRPVC